MACSTLVIRRKAPGSESQASEPFERPRPVDFFALLGTSRSFARLPIDPSYRGTGPSYANILSEGEKNNRCGKEVRFAATPPFHFTLRRFFGCGELDFIESRSGPTPACECLRRKARQRGRLRRIRRPRLSILAILQLLFRRGLSISRNWIKSRCARRFGGAQWKLGGITYYDRNFC